MELNRNCAGKSEFTRNAFVDTVCGDGVGTGEMLSVALYVRAEFGQF